MAYIPENSEALDKLAVKCGIEPGFRDVSGQYRECSAKTKRRLLRAMGVAAGDSAEVAASLQELEREEWKVGLPPIVVAYAGQPAAVGLVLAAGSSDLNWELKLEDGGVRAGTVAFGTLGLIAETTDRAGRLERRRLALGDDLPWGYHSLRIAPGDYEMNIVVTPGHCWLPACADGKAKFWGLASQVYLLRSDANWGIGDFSDLHQLMEIAASRGAEIVGINPIHSIFIDHPEHASPYSPSDRSLLNVLYIDVTAVPEFAHCREARELVESEEYRKQIEECRRERYVNYRRVTDLKIRALRLLFAHWKEARTHDRYKLFESFKRARGETFRRCCVFDVLRQELGATGGDTACWRNWPQKFQQPSSEQVERFASEHEEEVEFYIWLQWLADEQLQTAVRLSTPMAIGLYGDVAVGSHPDGAEAWSNQAVLAIDMSIGAPPDPFSREGQTWGLPPYNPSALRRSRYRPFIELMRANMRHRGALRIDHAMALQHLYWVPNGQSAVEGGYVSYPFEDLLGIVALESQRNRCAIVAEDLGTVPEGFRTKIAEAGMLSYRVLLFERRSGPNSFLLPSEYPKLSVAVAGNHDLATLRSWWEGKDLELKVKLGLLHEGEEMEEQRRQRAQDRRQLVDALCAEGLILTEDEIGSEELIRAVHAYLGKSGSMIALAQLDDITGEIEPVNVPGTVEQYPNWRRRLGVSLEKLSGLQLFAAITEELCKQRKGC